MPEPSSAEPRQKKGSRAAHGRKTQKLLFLKVSLLGLDSLASFAARTMKALPHPPSFPSRLGGDDKLPFGLSAEESFSFLKVLLYF